MRSFLEQLKAVNPTPEGRRWVFVPYDQLSNEVGPLAEEPAKSLGVILVESAAKAARRPYHKQKLALVLANLRHFALEQAARGVAIRYIATDASYHAALESLAGDHGGVRLMAPAERELRVELAPLVEDGALEIVPHGGWLTTRDQFERSTSKGPPWRMDAFYRLVRRETGVLMEDDKPVGGKWSYDAENRKRWPGEPEAPESPRFEPDDVTHEVAELIESRFGHHPGRVDLSTLPTTGEDANQLWRWAVANCLQHFGPYEDAMSTHSKSLFHTRISPLLNLHRLLPSHLVRETADLDAPLQSREGFIRQILGWREFMRHVHNATDGFRDLPNSKATVKKRPGDGGWTRWTGEEWPHREDSPSGMGGAAPSELDGDWPLPATFWGQASGLACLDRVVRDVWDDAYTHHIPRLMVLANLATLLGVRPRELTDWFWVAFADAYDWVVEPNVLGMGTFALGDLFTTKPYVSGANYIHKMSDFCNDCRFDPKSTCPITPLYWAFLERNRERLQGNPRMSLALRNVERRAKEQREKDRQVFKRVRDHLDRGEELDSEIAT